MIEVGKIATIGRPLRLTEAMTMVEQEVSRAKRKWPGSNPSAHHGYAVLQEEVEEAWDEIKADNLPKARAEMLQVAAMAIRFLMEAESPQMTATELQHRLDTYPAETSQEENVAFTDAYKHLSSLLSDSICRPLGETLDRADPPRVIVLGKYDDQTGYEARPPQTDEKLVTDNDLKYIYDIP